MRGLGDGSLDEAAFRFYIRQDYLFLIDYGRLLSLGAARAPRLEWMRRFAGLALSVLETEMALHREFAARWGVARPGGERGRARDRGLLQLPAARRRRWATSPSSPRRCCRACGATPRSGALAASASSDRYREWIDMYASAEFGELAAWARSIARRGRRRRRPHGGGVRRVLASTSSAFWDAAFSRQHARLAPAQRDLRRVEVLEVGLRVLA